MENVVARNGQPCLGTTLRSAPSGWSGTRAPGLKAARADLHDAQCLWLMASAPCSVAQLPMRRLHCFRVPGAGTGGMGHG
eukprot:scaffold32007_cov101-Isochrysis_galbana.AAC.3